MYACKTLNKLRIVEKKRERLILNERNVLVEVQSQFVINLKYSFQDDQALYLITDLLTGGDLQYHLNRFGVFPESWVLFYTAEVLLGLEYLHSKNIVYRDLKPENLLLDEGGFLKITDLGLASFIQPNEFLHQHCGTRSFMAPEQTYGEQGYGKCVDYWSLGVLMFQMLTGTNPFSKRHKNNAPPNPGIMATRKSKISQKASLHEMHFQGDGKTPLDDKPDLAPSDLSPNRPELLSPNKISLMDSEANMFGLLKKPVFPNFSINPNLVVSPNGGLKPVLNSPTARSERIGSAISLHTRRGSDATSYRSFRKDAGNAINFMAQVEELNSSITVVLFSFNCSGNK